jgi:hypothetical protein
MVGKKKSLGIPVHSPFTLANFSIVNLVFLFRCSSTTTNPVCERRVNLLVCSLSLHRHSYIGFILDFASSIHNKQTSISSPSNPGALLKAKVGSTLAKAETLRINLNIDGVSITSRTHTHPSHSETSRLLTSSLSIGVPVPRVIQCMRVVFSLSSHRHSYIGLVFSSRFID